MLVWASVALALSAVLLALALLADASASVLLVVGFGGAVTISALTGVQDGMHLRQESYGRRTASTSTEGTAELQEWRQAFEEVLAAERSTQGTFGEFKVTIEPETPPLEPGSLVLTEKDRALLALITAGLPLRDIAVQLNVSQETARKEWILLARKLSAVLQTMRRGGRFGWGEARGPEPGP